MPLGVEQLYRKIRFGEPIVVVSGLPRSGTSMTMKMLSEGGLELVTDGIRTADDNNPKGYYELETVKELGKATDFSWLHDARGKAIKIISYPSRACASFVLPSAARWYGRSASAFDTCILSGPAASTRRRAASWRVDLPARATRKSSMPDNLRDDST